MENIPHVVPKRSFASNPNSGFTSHKSVYDDVFGGPPKFGLPTLSPRLEDYSEIFGGFHASRYSSIPVLDIPPLIGDDDSELHFDARSPHFNYTEVFGDHRGLDWTVSFEDVVGQSSGGYDSSDEPWSPAKSGSLSDELDPLAGSDKSYRWSDEDPHRSLQNKRQLNMSYNKSSQRIMETVLAGTSHVTKFGAVPGYTCSHYEAPVSGNGEYEYCTMHVTDNVQHKKCLSNSSESGCYTHGNDYPSEKHESNSSSLERPFMTVSDISLRTKPSRLPPPSRPPPAVAVKKGESDRLNSNFKASKSYASERVADSTTPHFFDVEVDTTLSIKAMKNGKKDFNLNRACTKGSIERVDSWDDSKWHLEDVLKADEKINKTINAISSFQDDKVLQSHSCGKETTMLAPSAEDKIGSRKNIEELPEPQGGQYHQHITDTSAGPVAWREEKQYFEVIEKDISMEPFESVHDSNVSMQFEKPEAYISLRTTESEASEEQEDNGEFKMIKEAPRWDERRNQLEMSREDYNWGNKNQRQKMETRLGDERKIQEEVIPSKLACIYESDYVQKSGESEMPKVDLDVSEERKVDAMSILDETEANFKQNATLEIYRGLSVAQKTKENYVKHKNDIVRKEFHMGRAEMGERRKKRVELENTENQPNTTDQKANNKPAESHMPKEDERILKDANKHRESGKSCRASVHERNGDKQIVSDVDKDKELLMAAGTGKLNELTFTGDFENARLDKEQDLALEWGKMKEGNRDAILREVNDSRVTKDEISQINYLRSDAGMLQLSEEADEKEPIVMNRRQVEWDSESNSPIQESHSKVLDQTCYIEKEGATEVAGNVDNPHTLKKGQETVYCEGNIELKSQTNCSANESEAGIIDPLVKVKFNNFSKSKDDSQDESIFFVTNNTAESLSLLEQLKDSSTGRIGRKAVCIMPENIPTPLGYSYKIDKNVPTDDNQEQMMKRTEVIIEEVKTRDSFTSCQVVNGSKVKDASSVPECNKDQQYSSKNALNQSIVQKDKIMKENLVAKDQKVVDRIRRDIELENERLRKIEEEWEREREREKDRMAVDKAALEAYEKSHIEAREKAERAAVERATAEVRQRTMAVARERLEKSSMEARHRAERAAVERATAEARQRAVERSMAEKAASERVERTISDGFSVLSRSADTKQSFVSSDIQFQVTGISSGCRHSYFPAHVGAEGESPQRCKARLERYRRTAERAANALAEKNKRDLLAQKEREERNRVAETLEAEVKRWSRGKEGNLRALLSTLQYILGPNSGWQPVPLTEVITSAAVKKAYRKATLCVHPDKLQQRGATIQQKYTCEKVFDLLKEAWNKFNSEER